MCHPSDFDTDPQQAPEHFSGNHNTEGFGQSP